MEPLSDWEKEAIGKIISEGCTSGRLDSEERSISWELKFEAFD